jgi:hypothetical protein
MTSGIELINISWADIFARVLIVKGYPAPKTRRVIPNAKMPSVRDSIRPLPKPTPMISGLFSMCPSVFIVNKHSIFEIIKPGYPNDPNS